MNKSSNLAYRNKKVDEIIDKLESEKVRASGHTVRLGIRTNFFHTTIPDEKMPSCSGDAFAMIQRQNG